MNKMAVATKARKTSVQTPEATFPKHCRGNLVTGRALENPRQCLGNSPCWNWRKRFMAGQAAEWSPGSGGSRAGRNHSCCCHLYPNGYN